MKNVFFIIFWEINWVKLYKIVLYICKVNEKESQIINFI